MEDVTVEECCFSTPPIIMHKCLRFNDYAYAQRFDSLVNRFSNLCHETLLYLQGRANTSTKRGTLLSPMTFPRGI